MCTGAEDCASYDYKNNTYYVYDNTTTNYTEIDPSEPPEFLHWYNSMYYPVRMNTAAQIVDIETGKYS